MQEAATLLDFEHALPWANEVTLGAALWSWRYLAAVAALCALCLMTTIAAPAHRGRPR